ncbi:MMPL family transporter [Nocardioides flavus (ex Wang et al. 2016)]|uniref:MMPL family transporter n=1 Tax=Nocardioides flavus (ex Wang et al. 2016) TaxID=2058780 RepID=UPI001E591C30|nr:MMPL family transporter [Nocardioides flavus (ex Wang et al. 2016)]
MTPRQPLLFRLGRTAARHRGRFVATWLVLVVLGFATSLGLLGNQSLFDRLESGDIDAPGQAQTGRELLAETGDGGLTVMLRVDGADLSDPALSGTVEDVVSRVEGVDGVGRVDSPMTTAGWPRDPRSLALVADNDPASGSFVVVAETGDDPGGPVQDAVVAELEAAGEELAPYAEETSVGGTGLLVDDIIGQISEDLKRGEGIALPLSLLLMVVVFGGFVAAGMPILGAVAAIAGGLTILLGFSHAIDLDASVVNIVTVMGLALSIDYGLLLVSRFREELAHVAPGVVPHDLTREQVEDAVAGAVATAGRTILFSALVVGISLSGLMLFEAPIMRAIGAAGVSVVVVALVVALTLVPALCALGAKRLGRRQGAEHAPDEGVFSRLAAVGQRRPGLTTFASVAVLLFLAVPALDLRLNTSGVELLPAHAEQRVFFEALEEDFPALAAPTVTVVAQATPGEVAAWVPELEMIDGVTRVDPPRDLGPIPRGVEATGADPDGPGLVSVAVHTEGGAMDDAARETAATLRDAGPGFPTWTTGQAASLQDFTDAVWDGAPWAALWIGGATFVLLFLLTGSVVIPLKALVLNVVSLGASLGVTVWVFQWGNLESLLAFDSAGGIESVIPLLVLAFGFGLSMDYEIFLLARIIELHEQGHDDDTAVRLGLQRSGRIITSAALIMVIVFAGFAAGDMLVIKQTGLALAVAVALDATIVRMVIVPATMTMLGRWNWWAPGWMKRIHARWGVSEHSSPLVRQPAP